MTITELRSAHRHLTKLKQGVVTSYLDQSTILLKLIFSLWVLWHHRHCCIPHTTDINIRVTTWPGYTLALYDTPSSLTSPYFHFTSGVANLPTNRIFRTSHFFFLLLLLPPFSFSCSLLAIIASFNPLYSPPLPPPSLPLHLPHSLYSLPLIVHHILLFHLYPLPFFLLITPPPPHSTPPHASIINLLFFFVSVMSLNVYFFCLFVYIFVHLSICLFICFLKKKFVLHFMFYQNISHSKG